jgi:hypothetical protein
MFRRFYESEPSTYFLIEAVLEGQSRAKDREIGVSGRTYFVCREAGISLWKMFLLCHVTSWLNHPAKYQDKQYNCRPQ